MLERELEKLGLTHGEAKVYESLILLGSTKVGSIVKKSGVAYSNIYSVLQRLMEKGLVTALLKGKIKYFQAVPPKRILDYLAKQEAELAGKKQIYSSLLPQLEKLQKFNGINEQTELFIGEKGIHSAYERLLKDAKSKDELLFFSNYEYEHSEIAAVFYRRIYDLFKSKKILLRGISNSKTAPRLKSPGFIKEKKVTTPTPGNIDIFRDEVLILSWSVKPIAVLIESPEIAKNFRDYFNALWK